MDGVSLTALLSSPPVVSAFFAGALLALLGTFVAMLLCRTAGLRLWLLPIAAVALCGLAIATVVDRLAQDERGAERRALTQRGNDLTAQALSSSLVCLDDLAGETVQNACEKLVFANSQATAAAVAYVAARLDLLADAVAFARGGDTEFAVKLAGLRRSIELDRFGIAAHVLAVRDGCNADRCAAFAGLNDANVIKSNLKAQIFDQYVSRYAANWDKPAGGTQTPVAVAPDTSEGTRTPVAGKYDFPSAASIPPVSIMNAEPPLPKAAVEAQAKQTPGENDVPVPSRRPQSQAATPQAR